MKLTGAQALIKSLEMQGVETVFGLPGGAILPVYDPLLESPIRHILVRHEQGAGHAAEGFAQATGRPGVAIVTSGPAATNIVTAVADAYVDSIPIVVITGQVATTSIGTDAFQETDTTGITMSVTKHNWLITRASDIPRVIAEAFHVATTGRPGPVVVDLPKDVANDTMEWYWPRRLDLPGYQPTVKGHAKMIEQAAAMIASSKRPVIYAGGGLIRGNASAELQALVDRSGIPVVTTLMARGVIADSHPLCLGMPGMHGNFTAVTSLQQADLVIALGSRFDDRVTGKVDAFAAKARIIHVDIDPAELGKVRRPDVPIVGDVKSVIPEITRHLPAEAPDLSEWIAQLRAWKEQYPYSYEPSLPGAAIKPQYVVERISALAPADTVVVSGVGQHQMWASQYFKFERPNSWINSGGLGTMGFAVPAAIGAKTGRPQSTVWAIDGDGCFQMTAQELVTATAERIPIKVAILNNGYLGMVRQWQEMFYEERYSEVFLSPDLPDYVKWAEAMGAVGFRVDQVSEVDPVIEKANQIDDRPVVIDFRVDTFEKVFPMVPAGAPNDDIVLPPHQQRGR
ncbi:acetolactate synthase large subunit [Ferrimicrobium acidiphilum]|uniref:Acetolactate synthase n=1 Tax=Ferrimicrobium acidiphilum DSM 19497 TaxID=1121877 RepID=A0A0D8FW45_9ACTN|nr:acetolactate synthase large subunit [Ferrimicrobium acidiphilum]KJE77505.1 acetolactate synthase large subunit IlvB1 [Ferrimicrobium acidiphilum DSM 19497]